jgi:MoxR-like ATPase
MTQVPDPWREWKPEDKKWPEPEVSAKILGEDAEGRAKLIPRKWALTCARRLRQLRDELQGLFVGFEIAERKDHLLNWLLACLIARENALLLGTPGVAKTEIAESTFRLLGLTTPQVSLDIDLSHTDTGKFQRWWNERRAHEQKSQKYFRYLLSRFTQPDELFGPIEITLLRHGILAHINFGLLTGPGVRAAFLDEVFKASSSILNSLLTLTHEREYFNLGGMVKSDLIMFIGASNELPGGMATGTYGIGSGGEDFNLLYAFLDRFPIRLEIPAAAGGTLPHKLEESNLAKATELSLRRESRRFTTSDSYGQTVWKHGSPSINDVLLLGRCCLEQESMNAGGLFEPKALKEFKTAFMQLGATLQTAQTEAASSRITWTISPRKLKALYKIALAHALVCDDGFNADAQTVQAPGEAELHVFDFVWDSPFARDELCAQVQTHINNFWIDRRRRH